MFTYKNIFSVVDAGLLKWIVKYICTFLTNLLIVAEYICRCLARKLKDDTESDMTLVFQLFCYCMMKKVNRTLTK